ncbi:MAG: hypothetical protein EZS28_022816 [Streblomastix strix]|uniref:Uncharacterized protein n=1 Tax=Streblomastix strix TaxID=222440 RepID=A0A5J4VGD4_9EUKA|nr:MAG: hypothetical protein EZS28_022816 [Streblomastix strix]
MYKCFDMDRLHFIEGDTDSAYWAVSGKDFSESTTINCQDQSLAGSFESFGYKQQFKHVIKDQQFYNENAKYFFPTIEEELLDEKKILRLAIQRQRTEMIALAPKNYYIKVDDKIKIKLKGINQSTNKITKTQIVENIIEGTISKCINMRLGQKSYQMSKLAIEQNDTTGCRTKAIVLTNQSCCLFIFGLKAKNYSF